MKKILLFLSFLLMSIGVFSVETLVYTLEPAATGSNSSPHNNYLSGANVTISGIGWNVTGNSYMVPWRIGGKSLSGVDRKVYSTTKISDNISKIVITHGSASGITVNSMTIKVSTSQNGQGTLISTLSPIFIANNDVVVTRPVGDDWTNRFYTITYNVTVTGSSNKFFEFVRVKFYKENDTPCDSVSVLLIPPTHGTASLSKAKICKEETVEITDITPDAGYELDTIVCISDNKESVGTINNGVISNISEDCYVLISFKEVLTSNIDIVEWNPNWLKIDIENFTAASAILEDQNTLADIQQNFADSVFFSKYFEAAANVKLLGIYNGTNHTIDVSDYQIWKDNSDNSGWANKKSIGALFTQYEIDASKSILTSGSELILIGFQNAASDSVIIRCAKDTPSSNYDTYIRLGQWLDFNGDDAVALVNPEGNLIDLIGAGTKTGGRCLTGGDVVTTNSDAGNVNGFMDKPGGWYTEKGYKSNIDHTEEANYKLSSNRCLLIRRKHVKSGLNAVQRNTTKFLTLGDYTYNTINYEGEWKGIQIPGKTSDGGATASCTGFEQVGSYDYSDYYIDYDTIYTEDKFTADTTDGYYKIEIPNLDALSCTNLKITVKNSSNNILEDIVKIPIMIKDSTNTKSDYFKKKDCDECDVVVLRNQILTVFGTTTANRDVKLYEGAELRVPEDSLYTINSLAFRRYNDTVSSLKLGGTLTVNKVYFDLYITPDDWHYISLPDTFIVSNVKYVNGKSPRYGTDCLAKYYDGEYRSQHYKGGWKSVEVGMKFNPGNGFTFGLSDAFKKKEFRFELNPNVITYEKTNKNVIDLHAWGIANDELRPNHKGWNLIGNPFMSHFEADIAKAIRAGYLYKDETSGSWNGQWLLSDTTVSKLRYAVIPSKAPEDKAAGGYKSVVLDDMKLLPFTCFFVQMGGTNENAQGIQFKVSQQRNRIVARNYQEEEDDELFLRVKVDDWKTGMFISSKFSEEYEPGDDLESRYPIYQNLGGYKLLYSAINDSIIESGVTITAPLGKLCLDSKVDIDKFEYIYVNYNNNWYDLMHGEVIDIETGNFILQAKRKVNNIPTGLNMMPTEGLYKFSDGNNVYINRNNTIFNILGNKIK